MLARIEMNLISFAVWQCRPVDKLISQFRPKFQHTDVIAVVSYLCEDNLVAFRQIQKFTIETVFAWLSRKRLTQDVQRNHMVQIKCRIIVGANFEPKIIEWIDLCTTDFNLHQL